MAETQHEAAERRGPDRVTTSTVLIVDDSTAIRRILDRALTSQGYDVLEAADGRAALEVCRTQSPDLVLLDVDMPVMGGLETLEAMKADPALAQLPVLFLTARTDGTDVARGLELGAQDYLRKPCDPAELSARVRTALLLKAREVELSRQATEAAELSATDTLTGLGNRRHLDARVAELRAEHGNGGSTGVLLLDIDHFKAVNDNEGHLVGDIVLRVLAQRVLAAAGADDVVVRWGGEEFLVLVPGAHISEAMRIGEAVRLSIASSPFAIEGGRVLDITVSIGVACGRYDALDLLTDAADGALYEAKRGGRNRVVRAG